MKPIEQIKQILHKMEINRGYLRYPVIFTAAAIVASSRLFGEVTPIALVFIGSLAGGDCLFAFFGTLFAFTLGGQFFEAVPALAVMMVIGAFRFFLGNIQSRTVNISSALLTGISAAIVGSLSAVRLTDVITAIIIAVASGILCYSLIITYRFLAGGHMTLLLKFSSVAAPGIVTIFAAAVLSNFSHVREFNINAGVLLGTVAALAFANKYRYSGGSIVGIMTAVGVMLSTRELSSGMLVFAASSTASGIFAKFGRITQSAGFVLCMGIGISLAGINTYTLSVMAGTAIGSIIYAVIPIDALLLSRVGNSSPANNATAVNGTDISEIFAERLRLASEALSDVKSAVEKAGEILDKRNVKDFSWVYNTAGDMICRKCKNNMICWGEEYNDTVNSFNKLSSNLRMGKPITEKDLPPNIAAEGRCKHKQQLIFALGERYREFTSINSANRKINEMRTVLTAQLSATENLMLDMSDEFLDYVHYDGEMAAQMEKILSENGAVRPRVAVIINEGRASIEGYGKGKLTCDAAKLGDLAAETLHRQFDLPEIIHAKSDTEFRFTMHERAVYGVEYGAYQLSKSSERSCGDYYDSFVDGKGYAYIILSDGMGSGSRARIDSAFACGMLVKLLRAGIGLPSAVEIINNSLLVKSSDESFATLDICKIDLYTGKTELYKAGAAASYIFCNKKLVKAVGNGLPVGIGYRAVYESRSFTIGNSDMIIMASDGAELNEKWLEHHLNDMKSADLNETAKFLADTARYSANDGDSQGREDDISVIAVKLVK